MGHGERPDAAPDETHAGDLLKQNKRVAFGFSIEINKHWPNAYFANAGLFALHTARQSARQSR